MSVEDRVTELETRLAFQDDTIQALNEALVDQQRQMERLGLQLGQLIERYRDLAGQYGEAGDEAPPPHY